MKKQKSVKQDDCEPETRSSGRVVAGGDHMGFHEKVTSASVAKQQHPRRVGPEVILNV